MPDVVLFCGEQVVVAGDERGVDRDVFVVRRGERADKMRILEIVAFGERGRGRDALAIDRNDLDRHRR